ERHVRQDRGGRGVVDREEGRVGQRHPVLVQRTLEVRQQQGRGGHVVDGAYLGAGPHGSERQGQQPTGQLTHTQLSSEDYTNQEQDNAPSESHTRIDTKTCRRASAGWVLLVKGGAARVARAVTRR